MITSGLKQQRSSFAQGLVAGISIALGYIPAGLTFGLLAKGTGLSLMETMAMSYLCLPVPPNTWL